MWFRIVLLIGCLLAPTSLFADEPRHEPSGNRNEFARELSAVVRDGLNTTNPLSVGQLKPVMLWNDPRASETSVVLVPGLFAGDGSMSRIRRELNRNNIATATFRYADQKPVRQVAMELSRVIQRLRQRDPDRRVSLVTHSLGGIVAREAIEPEDQSPTGIDRLIMIAPPNRGTQLASLSAQDFAICVDEFGGERNDLEIIDEMIHGFVGDAKRSLQPSSRLLEQLNSRQRAAGVRYTIIAGTGGPIRREWVELPLLLTGLLLQDERDPRALAPLQRLAQTEEWIFGSGDGVVAVRSTRLAGVEDVASFPFGHNDFGSHVGDDDRRAAADQALQLVVRRLKQPID